MGVAELVGNWTIFAGGAATLYTKFEVVAVLAVSAEGALAGNAGVELNSLSHLLGAGDAISAILARPTKVAEGIRSTGLPMAYLITVTADATAGAAGAARGRVLKVRKTPSWPRSWANCSLL